MADDAKDGEAEQMVDQAVAEAKASLDELAGDVNSEADADPIAQLTGASSEASSNPDAENKIQLLNDVDLHVMIELGRTEMVVEDVLRLTEGSVVELDKLAGDPVDVYVNQRLVARGEVLVLNDNFCIRVSEIVDDLEEQAEAAVSANAETSEETSTT